MVREADLSEDAAGRKMIDLARQIDAWNASMEVIQEAPPPGSPLAADDRWTSPYQISQAVWMAVSHAVDNLHAFRSLTLSGGPEHYRLFTRPYGAYPNLRATIENASAALWLLGPSSRDERVLRRLRWALHNAKNRDRLAAVVPSVAANFAEVEKSVARVAEARGLPAPTRKDHLGFEQIVREAGPFAHFEPDGAVAIWRILSGMTHGDVWATFSLAQAERLFETADGVRGARLTTSVDLIVTLCQVACLFVVSAHDLMEKRRMPPFGPAPATEPVASSPRDDAP